MATILKAVCDYVKELYDAIPELERRSERGDAKRKEQIQYLGQGAQKQSEAIKRLAENVKLLEGVALKVRLFMLFGIYHAK